MSQFSPEDEVELQSLLRQLLTSIKDRIAAAPSIESAEEILLHLEETDKNFHNYEFVRYLRQYVENSLGTVVEEETETLARADGQPAIGPGQDTLIHAITRRTRESAEYKQMMQTLKNTMIVVVESLINRFEEDQMRKEETDQEKQHGQSNSHYTDNCSDSDSSFNQSYAFLKQEQLQALAEKLDSSRPKEVRQEALQALCCAPPSDVLSSESWSSLRRNLSAALAEPDPELSDKVLQFFAKTLSSSPLNVTREIYTSLGRLVYYIHLSFIFALCVQMRLMNDFQKEVTTFWIRHPEKYMEEVIESTFSLLSLHPEHSGTSPGTEKSLEPVHLLALLDVKATWFKKWMHGYYSRTVVFRLLERKYNFCVASVPGSVQRSVYTAKELEYAYFVHSLCILGKLLIYTNGRKLFPIKVRQCKGAVVTFVLCIASNIYYSLSPSGLVMELLWTLCERTECTAPCLHQTPVIQTLLAPVIALLTLSVFCLLSSTTAAHVIVQFTQKLLDKQLPSLSESEFLHTVCGAFIFVCRQMYNTCEGLQVLRPYGLHRAIAAAWKKTSSLSDRVPTPVPGASAGTSSPSQELQNMLWEEMLLDSLLNFAVTPKGLLLLQQTGAISECVSYMFSRFTKKLQVSRCEKFGYGVMVTQVAATAPGVMALHSSGFVQALVVELWSALECGREDIRVVHPKPTPMDPIDRSCLKSFLSLVNLLSSSQSVWELLSHQPLANKSEYTLREIPTSIPDLIDRLIAVNSDAKIHSLFNYEQSHTFGLRLLSVLCCNLDSFLLLESQYNISALLLQSQGENVTDEFIIDSLSVERNHVLVRASVVGGPSERRLPPRALQEGESPFPWPMFSSKPLPQCYTLETLKANQSKQDCEISTFLASSKDTEMEESWMEICRRQYCKVMTTKPNTLTGTGRSLAQWVAMQLLCYQDFVTSTAQVRMSDPHVCVFLFCLICRYGSYLKLLKEDAVQDLTQLLKHIELFLSTQRANSASELTTLQDGYPGHDWLASTVFLIMAGDMDRSLRLLLNLSSLLTSAFIWPARIHASVHVPVEIAGSGIPPVYWCTAHYVEMLLKAEVPLVHSAFRMSGFTPSQMCLQWLGQCFWNYLDWPEICHYLSTCVVMGPDYQVYMCVAVLKHLQPDILLHTQSQDLQVFLKEEPIQGFRVSDYLEYMEGLERSYRSVVLTDMKNIRNPVA
uniref:Protein broad-minded n=1 Tax=Myripristis murdjan TaxID=586833 RepID=A0A668AQ63_9TELE